MATRNNVTVRDLGFEQFLQEIENARGAEVTIGIHQGEVKAGQQIAEYAMYNEYGTSKIPERSFMRTAFDDNLEAIQRRIAVEFASVQSGQSDMFRALSRVGLFVETRIKDRINSNIQPANHPYTIAQKGSSRTLIDTGAMLASVRYVVTIGSLATSGQLTQVNAPMAAPAGAPVYYDVAR